MKRWLLIGALVVVGSTRAHARPVVQPVARIDMGAWDCNGSKVQTVSVSPGRHDYAWHGHCNGAEGYDVVVEPRGNLIIRMETDRVTGDLVLHVTNRGRTARRVKMHVFVGFA